MGLFHLPILLTEILMGGHCEGRMSMNASLNRSPIVATLNSFAQVEPETIAFSSEIKRISTIENRSEP